MNVDMDGIVISIESTTEKASNAIDTLISKLNELQTALSNVGKASSNFKNISKNISSTPKNIRTPKTTGTSGNVEDQLDKLKVNLKDYDVASVFKSESTRGITSEITKYKNELGDVVTVQKKMRDGMDDYYRVTKKTTNEGTSGFEKFRQSTTAIIGKFATLGLAAKSLLNHMMELTETSAEYTEAVNLFYTEMGDKAQEAEKWVKKFTDALYLDPADVMGYMGAFNSLVSGLGVGADNSYKMSKNLTQLAYDLSSYKNISVESAFDKLQSGVAGQIKGLRQVGVALSQNTLQELANEMGINRRINTLDEASEAQLRYIQIMRSSTNWQGDLGKTMMSTENILRSARTQWTLMARELGNLAAVIVRALMPYFIALTQIIREAAVALAKFFGFNIDFGDAFKTDSKNVGVNLEAIKDGIGDVGSAAKKAKKDINSMLAPFDDLNVVQTKVEQAGSGSSGSSGGASLGDLPLPEYDALSKLTGEWSGKIEEAKKKLKSIIPIVGSIVGLMAGVWAINKISKLISSVQTLGGLFKGLGGILGGTSGGIVALAIGIWLASILALKREVPKLSKAFEDLVFNGKSIKEVSKEFSTLDWILLGFLQGVNKTTGGILGVFTTTYIVIDNMRKKVVQSKDVVKELGDNISKVGKTKLTPLVSEFENFSKKIDNFHFANKVIKKSDIDNIKQNLGNIKSSVINELDADKNSQLKNLKTIEKALGIDKANELYSKTESYYKGQKEIITKNSGEIEKILQTASKNNRSLTDEEVSEIKKLRDGMYETGVRSALEYSDDYYGIMAQLKNNLVAISTEQASSYIKKAKETRDKTIKSAKEQYDNVVGEAYKMKDAGAITEEEYNKIVDAADKTYNETVNKANKQYDEIYNATTEKLGKNGKYIDKETGNIKTRFQVMGDTIKEKWKESLETIKNTASEKWNDLSKWYKKNIAPKFTKEYWKSKFNNMVKGVSEKLNELKEKFTNWKATIKTPHIKWTTDGGHKASGAIKKILEALNLPTTIPKLDVKWYESGGYPDRASLFWANENGIPEMVGQIGNRTAVANNDQITTSITNALITALSGMNFGGQGTTVVNIGNKKVYEGMGEYLDGESERYGTSYVNI